MRGAPPHALLCKLLVSPWHSQVYKGGAALVTALFSAGAYIYASARTLVITGGGAGGAGGLHAPPPITTHSDERSVRLASDLQVGGWMGWDRNGQSG